MIKCVNVHKNKELKKEFNEKWVQIIKIKWLAS